MGSLVPVATLIVGAASALALVRLLILPHERLAITSRLAAESSEKDLRYRLLEESSRQRDREIEDLRREKTAIDLRLATEVQARIEADRDGARLPELRELARAATAKADNLVVELGKAQLATLTAQAELKSERDKVDALTRAEKTLSDTFQAIASRVIQDNNASFLDLARERLGAVQGEAKVDLDGRKDEIGRMIRPLGESIERFDNALRSIEIAREGAYRDLIAQVGDLRDGQRRLSDETNRLVGALRSPNARGSWAEMQLKRIAEMAGMVEHCDFSTQETIRDEDGAIRPDMIVRLAGGRNIVIDAKAPLAAYLQAADCDSEELRGQKLREHSRHVRDHIASLGRKEYWSRLQPCPEFVILFLPAEVLYSAALQHDSSLIEFGSNQKVILTTPNTLIGLLRAVAFGWNQEVIAREAEAIKTLGQELYERIRVMGGHALTARTGLNKAVDGYNKFLVSLESRVLTTARRFRDFKIGVGGKEIAEVAPISTQVRALTKPDLVADRGRLPLFADDPGA